MKDGWKRSEVVQGSSIVGDWNWSRWCCSYRAWWHLFESCSVHL